MAISHPKETTHERSSTRPDHVGPHRGGHHDGVPHRLHPHGLGHGIWLHRLLRPQPTLVRQQNFQPDGATHFRRDDQRHPVVHSAVCADGLCDGTRRPRRQNVPQRATGLPPLARLSGSSHLGDLHLLGHCQWLGRRGGGVDGRDCDAPHAQRWLRHAFGGWRDYRWRHLRHFDSAVRHDHRVRGGRGSIGGQALCGRHVPRLLLGVFVFGLRDWLGLDRSQDRSEIA